MTVFGRDRFRMELHTFDRQRLVAQTHDLAVGRPGSDFQTSRQRFALDRQRVIAGRGKWRGQVGKDADTLVFDRRGLAMHQLVRAHDLAAEDLANRLVPKADAEYRRAGGETLQKRQRNAGPRRRTRSGRNTDPRRPPLGDLVERDLVVARDAHVFAELAKVLDQVVSERIVVVDHQQHGVALHIRYLAKNCLNAASARSTPLASTSRWVTSRIGARASTRTPRSRRKAASVAARFAAVCAAVAGNSTNTMLVAEETLTSSIARSPCASRSA